MFTRSTTALFINKMSFFVFGLAPRTNLERLPSNKDSFTVCEGPHSTMDSKLASHPAAPGSIRGVPKIFSDLDVAEIY